MLYKDKEKIPKPERNIHKSYGKVTNSAMSADDVVLYVKLTRFG
jgi:hypothetical protein